MGHPWPLFDLRLRTPRLELRLPTDDDLLTLVRAARAGLHAPDETPFLVPWDELPSPAFERQFLEHNWRERGSWQPDAWQLNFAVVLDGAPIGQQGLFARDFAKRRTVSTGSWLALEHQRRGLGTEMRAAVLWLAFEGLNAEVAESGYVEGNVASARVSERLGYVANGVERIAPRGVPAVERRLWLTRETWRRDLVPVTIEGLEACLPLFGAADLGPDDWATL